MSVELSFDWLEGSFFEAEKEWGRRIGNGLEDTRLCLSHHDSIMLEPSRI